MTPSRPRLAALAVCLLTACASLSRDTRVEPSTEVARLLGGSFSSAAQAGEDPDYFDIRLHVVPIWTERADGPWLYVEQAASRSLDRPYRQRVYRVMPGDAASVRSRVYELPGDPLRFAGAWRAPRPLDRLTPSDLVPMEGCDVVLSRGEDGAWCGGTVGEGCATEWGGAAYATSVVELEPGGMTSWDRGWSAEGVQVWGAVKGPYRFTRLE